MLSIHKVAVKVAGYMARELKYDRQKEIMITFGLELFLGTLVKLTCVMMLAYFLGIFRETMVIVLVAGLFRLVSGGEHCQAYYRCLIGGTVFFLMLGFLAKSFNSIITYNSLIMITLVSFPVVIAIVWIYAPGDTENKPITEETEKVKYKKLSLMITIFFLSVVILFLTNRIFMEFVLPIKIALLWQAFTITPWGYRLIRGVDRILLF